MRRAVVAALVLAAAAAVLLRLHHARAVHATVLGEGSAGSVAVSTSPELEAALAATAPRTIVLADGTYSSPSAFSDDHGHRILARHRLQAVFTTGLSLRSRGAAVEGVRFDVSDPSRTVGGAIVEVWGGASSARVADVSLDGHRRIDMGLRVAAPEGFVGRRIVARRFTGSGILVDTYPRRVRAHVLPVLDDLDVADVSRPIPRSSNGTAEACIWIGTAVRLDGAKIRDCAWDGLWTGFDATHARFANVDVDDTPVGVYAEHYSTGSVYTGIHVGRHVRIGLACEWADPAYRRRPACDGVVVENGVFESYRTGVFLDEGTRRTVVRNSTFAHQRVAAIVDYRGRGNSYSGNDFSGIETGAATVSREHG